MLTLLGDWKRTNYCGEINKDHINKNVVLMGWVHKRRDHGGVIFLDLRDRTGLVQVVFSPENKDNFALAGQIRNEYVIAVKGVVRERPEGTINPKIKTGFVEINGEQLKILNDSQVPPFILEDKTNVGEEIRLKYRYLDLRRQRMQNNIIIRDKLTYSIREFLHNNGFIDVETPFLAKSTPEGARDYLVPSRVNPGKFYALPQSPQIFKQLLMISGFDKYYQIVRCFRDEDLRADRQPEFTQLDMEMSFIDREDLLQLLEKMFKEVLKKVFNIDVDLPFPRITYEEAIDKYGTDAPDVRFGLYLKTLDDIVKDCNYNTFKRAVEEGGTVRGINLEGANFSRKDIDNINNLVLSMGGSGIAYIRITNKGISSPLSKYLGDNIIEKIVDIFGGKEGDIIFIMAGEKGLVNLALSKIRIDFAKRKSLIKDNEYAFIWVLDFPLFEYNKDEGRYEAMHHPFTSPLDEDLEYFDKDPSKIRAKAYDLVMNGVEIGGGSIRIHRSDIQNKMFETLGLSDEDIKRKFGFFIDALKYGTPPHGGIAFGLDRITAILTHSDSIRDVIAFPKTQKAVCLMTSAPSEVDEKQLKELNIKLDL
ncbi:MAG: aspartate--tRNA ligase [Deferribacterota bacterium]|nr:aspartate--tRNA ligase [Deferribacterota bacterium]